ncbi:putative squalene synthase [Trypanosoma cruzi]|uniref:Putative squalene synthase n=1 Tax=Trypanosoma cruzi TaxID=5693 RepID=A0A2V2UTB3_TRYCR|nr:putative squalene synthase [Trypanosoma cruzi]
MEYMEELYAMVRMKWRLRRIETGIACNDEDLRFCYDILQAVSRSFAIVIMELDEEMRDAVCIFYLVLRALDTVEDDMSIPIDFKLRELPKFHEHLHDTTWCMSGVGVAVSASFLSATHTSRAPTRGLARHTRTSSLVFASGWRMECATSLRERLRPRRITISIATTSPDLLGTASHFCMYRVGWRTCGLPMT